MGSWIVLVALIVVAPAIIYQISSSMKELREARMEEMKQRSEMDAKILGLDTSSSEIRVELGEIRKEIAEIKQMIGGGAKVRSMEPEAQSEAEVEQTRQQRESAST